MQEESKNNLKVWIQSKNYSEAQEFIKNSENKKKDLQSLTNIYHEIQFEDEEEYQHFLYLYVMSISPEENEDSYQGIIEAIIQQIVGLSSLKYTIIILGSFLLKIEHESLAIFALLSNLHIFSPLLFENTFDNVKNIYFSFNKARMQLLSVQKHFKHRINSTAIKSFSKFYHSILKQTYKINHVALQEVLIFLGTLFKDYQKIAFQQQKLSEQMISEKDLLFLIEKFQILPSKVDLPLPFAVCLFKQYSLGNTYFSTVYSKTQIAKQMLQTLCLQLPQNINDPPQTKGNFDSYLLEFIYQLSLYLNQNSIQKSSFILENFKKVEELIEKINIFLGALNPQDFSYKKITTNFLPLNFLTPQIKEQILAKIISKHENLNFKTHLITQYRKLLTFSSSKTVWLRSIQLLFKELKNLEPKTSIDYIGHIISFAYYWKGVTEKFCKNSQFKKQLYFNLDHLMKQFNEHLQNLKKGLQTKIKIAQNTISELERNEINVCIFRIDELFSLNIL